MSGWAAYLDRWAKEKALMETPGLDRWFFISLCLLVLGIGGVTIFGAFQDALSGKKSWFDFGTVLFLIGWGFWGWLRALKYHAQPHAAADDASRRG